MASTHDSQIDLSEYGEDIYRDRGYFGAEIKEFNTTMLRGVRGLPIGIRDKLRNAGSQESDPQVNGPMPSSKTYFISLTPDHDCYEGSCENVVRCI